MQMLVFCIGEERFGLLIDEILSIENFDFKYTELPQQERSILGIKDIRGKTTTIYDLPKILKVSSFADQKKEAKLILFDLKIWSSDDYDGSFRGSLLVDEVESIIDVSENDFQEVEFAGNSMRV